MRTLEITDIIKWIGIWMAVLKIINIELIDQTEEITTVVKPTKFDL